MGLQTLVRMPFSTAPQPRDDEGSSALGQEGCFLQRAAVEGGERGTMAQSWEGGIIGSIALVMGRKKK